MGAWLGIDPGTVRVGIAAGNTRDGIASPLTTLPAEPHDELLREIARLADDYAAEGIVVGWPLNMDDSEGPQGLHARALAADIEAECNKDVRLWDERLSSFTADGQLAGRLTRKKRKARQDALAAAVMLQDFFACGGPDAAPRPGELPRLSK